MMEPQYMDVMERRDMEDLDEESSGPSERSIMSMSATSQAPEETPIGELLRKDALRELQSIDLEVLARLASATNGGARCTISLPATRIGASNIVLFIDFDGASPTRWAARFPLVGWNCPTDDPKLLTELIESMVTTMKYLSQKTTIPLPKIHCWSGTSENELKRPYVIMDAASGSNMNELARNGLNMGDTVEHLSSFVDQWAMYTAELASIEFGRIGSLREDVTGNIIVDRLCSQANLHYTPQAKEDRFRGPFNSVGEYLLTSCELKYHALSLGMNNLPYSYRDYLQSKLVETLLPFYVNMPLLKGPFVLSHVDLNIQNILVDENDGFKITGIVDWDLAAVLPLQSHLRVPDIFICDTWTEEMRHAKSFGTWHVNFAKKYRTLYQSSLSKYLREKHRDYPVEKLVQNGYLFSLFEKALFDKPTVETVETLWKHVYGADVEWKRILDGMLSSDWGLATAEESPFPMDEEGKIDNGERNPSDDGKAANTEVAEGSPAQADIQPTPHTLRSKWTSRLSYKIWRGWNRIQRCLLCDTEPIQLPPRMRSNPGLGHLWWTSNHR
jgi:hypothetical protein